MVFGFSATDFELSMFGVPKISINAPKIKGEEPVYVSCL